MKSAYLIALTALLSTLDVASAAWQKIPASGSAPVNLASNSIVGTKVISSSGLSNSPALLADDPSQLAKLPSGTSSAVVDINDQTLVDFVSFVNDGATGKVSVSASTNNSNWVELSQQTFDSSTLLVELKFAGIQAKYVRLSFDLAKSGAISSLKVTGANKASDYRPVTADKNNKAAADNLMSGPSGSRPVYMFPTPTSFGESEGSYKFPKSSEKYRTIVYDLGDSQTLKKFSASYSKIPTRVEVFAFDQLPEKKDWRGKTTFDPSILETTKPVAIGEDSSGAGRLNLVSSQPVTAKYIVMRFEPNYSKRVAGLNIEWQSMAVSALIPFSGAASQLGILNVSSLWQPVAAAGEGEFVVVNTSITEGGKNVRVYISKSAIAKVQAQMGEGTSEAAAINAILNKAGFDSVTDVKPGEGANNANKEGSSGENVADPALSNALSAFGLSAYRNGGTGGIGGVNNIVSPNNNNNNNSSNNGNNGPIIVITETVNPASP